MAKLQHSTRAFGSPSRYVQGRFEIGNIKEYTEIYGDKVFFLIDVFFYDVYSKKFSEMYQGSDSKIQTEKFSGETTEAQIQNFTAIAKELCPNVVVGMGGGKTMDTAKAVANNFNAKTIIVPTTASTDAPTISLSVIYTSEGEHIGARHYAQNPDLVLLDTDIISKAPVRFLVSGMGDALSTYIEARANQESNSPNYIGKGFQRSIAAIAIAKACHETILSKGVSAKIAVENGLCIPSVEDVIEANTLLSGLGVQNTSCAGAHSIAEGITVLEACKAMLHGELVFFGILVQLIAEGRSAQEIDEIYQFGLDVGLPVTFEDVNLKDVTEAEIRKVAEESLHSYWDVEPFVVNEQKIYDALIMADIIGKKYKK